MNQNKMTTHNLNIIHLVHLVVWFTWSPGVTWVLSPGVLSPGVLSPGLSPGAGLPLGEI